MTRASPSGIDAVIIEPGTFPTPLGTKRQLAADSERLVLYKDAITSFMTSFFSENRSATPPDPQQVADAVASIIAQPAGERPLRTVVATPAQSQGTQALNEASIQAAQSVYDALNVSPPALAVQGDKT